MDDVQPINPNSLAIGQPRTFSLSVATGGIVWCDGAQGVLAAEGWLLASFEAWDALLPARTSP